MDDKDIEKTKAVEAFEYAIKEADKKNTTNKDKQDTDNEKWCNDNIVFLPDGFYVLDRRTKFRSKQLLQDSYAHRNLVIPSDKENGKPMTVQVVDRIKNNPHKMIADGVAWFPVATKDVHPLTNIEGRNYVNEYQPVTMDAIEGNVSQWLKLVDFICGEYADDVLDHMAFTIQHPDKKIIWQIMVVDPVKRNGKTAIFTPLLNIMGSNAGTVNPELLKKWDDEIIGKKVLIMEEVYGFDSKQFNQLKTKFSNTDFELLNRKTMGTVLQANRYSMYMLTNHENAFQMRADEGKLLVIKGPGNYIHGKGKDGMPNDASREFYRKYWDWLRSESGQKALLYYLMNRDISNFKYNEPAKITDALHAACEAGEKAYVRRMNEMVEDFEKPFDKVGVNLPMLFKALKMDYSGLSENGVREALKMMGFISVRGQKKINGKPVQVRFWAKTEHVEGKSSADLYMIHDVDVQHYVQQQEEIYDEIFDRKVEKPFTKVVTPNGKKDDFDFINAPLLKYGLFGS